MRTTHFALAAMACILITPRLEAQRRWGLTAEWGSASFSGHARSVNVTPEASGHPSSGGTLGLRLDRSGPRVTVSLGILLASTGVEFESEEAAAEFKDLLSLLEIAPEVSVVVWRPREAALRLHGGLVLDRWSPDGDEARTAMGILSGVSVEMPFTSRVGLRAGWQMTVTGSVFDDDDLPPEFERRTGTSQRWVVGVRLGL